MEHDETIRIDGPASHEAGLSTQLNQVIRYPFPSHFEDGWGLRLATAVSRSDAEATPYFFEGRALRPEELSGMLLVLSEVVRSRFYLPGAMRELDPVVTSSRDALRFEGFSSCCGVYARADLVSGAFDADIEARGTTNVDFNSTLRGTLRKLRTGGEARLSVGAGEIALTTNSERVVEKKVKLPVRWLKGFTEVQSYLAQVAPCLAVPGIEALRFLRSLPRAGSPKRPTWVVPFRGGLRLSSRSSADGVRVLGTERLRLLEPLVASAQQLHVWFDDTSGVSAWHLEFETGHFWLVLSPEVSRGFSGEGQALALLADPRSRSVVQQVRAQLRWQSEIRTQELAEVVNRPRSEIDASLASLAARGLVGFDPRSGCYFHRELPFDLDRVERLQPRLVAARRLVAEGRVRWRSSNPSAPEALVHGSVEHRVRLAAGDAEIDRCTCRWFSRNQGDRGPCKHILATRLDLEAQASSHD